MKNELKVGFVGAPRASGFIGTFQTITETTPVALCDIRPEVLQQVGDRFGIEQRYTDYEKMVETDLDIIVVTTPMPLHAPQSVMALKNGKHVLSEVPATTDLEQCWQYRNWEFGFRNSELRNCLPCPLALLPPCPELKGLNEITVWRRKWQTGRNGSTYPTHSLGPVLQWFEDRVATVSCFGSGHHYQDPRGHYYENEDTTLMLCKMQRGGLMEIRLDMLSNRPHNMTYYSLQGAKGCYEAPRGFGDSPKIWLADYSDNPNQWRSLWDFEAEFMPEIWRKPPEEALRAGHRGGDYFEVRGFIDSIINDTKPPIDVYEAMDMTVPGLVSEEFINNGGIPLPVPDFRTIQRFPDDLPESLRKSSIISVTL